MRWNSAAQLYEDMQRAESGVGHGNGSVQGTVGHRVFQKKKCRSRKFPFFLEIGAVLWYCLATKRSISLISDFMKK